MPALAVEIWSSFRRLPLWVQIWIAALLVPVNMLSLAFVGHASGFLVALLAIGGMAPNAGFMIYERGLSRAMSLSHLVFWTPLIVVIIGIFRGPSDLALPFSAYLIVLLGVDLISLAFDIPDSWRWFKGKRQIA